MHQLPVQDLEASSFSAFGRIMDADAPGFTRAFEPDTGEPWIIGINNVHRHRLDSMHRHPRTWECFSPVEGLLYLAVAPATASPEDIQGARADVLVFRICHPVCVAPRVWHCLLAPGHSRAFICENASVVGEEVLLHEPMVISMENGPSRVT